MTVNLDMPAKIAAQDRRIFSLGANVALMEAHRLLCVAQQNKAADVLLRHAKSIMARAETHWQTQEVITKAAETT